MVPVKQQGGIDEESTIWESPRRARWRSAPDRRWRRRRRSAVVVKGLDNAFFTVMGNGCAKWNEEHTDSPYTCVYTGPALTSDEAGEIQIVSDLIARDGVAGIAISPSNAPAMAKLLTEKADEIKAKKIAIMTIDADLKPEDQGLRTTYFGTHNYGMGVKFCQWLKKL